MKLRHVDVPWIWTNLEFILFDNPDPDGIRIKFRLFNLSRTSHLILVKHLLKMAVTRSNRRGDWTRYLTISPTTRLNQGHTMKQLTALQSLPVFPKIPPNTAQTNQDMEIPTRDDLSDTSMYPEIPTPPRFGVELLPHQKRSLSWMLLLEHKESPILFKQNEETIRVFGGILADKPGTGKSILTIALIKLNPCRGFFKDDRTRTRSKATLILCPRNIVDQWTNEIRRCDPSLTILQITTARALNSIPSLDLVLADVILVPYNLLADPSYINTCTHVETLNPPALTTYDDLCGYRGILTRFHFHRIVYDEIHEIYNINSFIESFHANWRWGITGTPPRNADLFRHVLNCIARANLQENPDFQSLKLRIVKSNSPDLGIPTLTQEIKWIDLTARELALYNLSRSRPIEEQLMACCHFNINNVEPDLDNLNVPETMTIDEATEKLVAGHNQRIAKIELQDLPTQRAQIPILETTLTHLRVMYYEIRMGRRSGTLVEMNTRIFFKRLELEDQRKAVQELETDIVQLKADIQYFQNILKTLGEDGEQSCPICFDGFTVGRGLIGLTTCGHAFCKKCLERVGNAPCPTCRQYIDQSKVMFVSNSKNLKRDILRDIYGTKIHEMVQYIMAQLSLDPAFKFIIFVQYSKLATVVTNACFQYDLKALNLCGTVKARTDALKKFEQEAGYKVLLLSYDQSVAGVNITAASHVLILHPFNLATDAESVEAEQQGISRAHRLGQTRPVKFVRFVTRGTIEERITRERIGSNWIQDAE